jgi:hypothetical protein
LNWDSFRFRNYDYAIGRFMTIDPLAEQFPQWSPYVFSGNLVTMAKELEGLEPAFLIDNNGKLTQGTISVMHAAFGYSVHSLSNSNYIPHTDPRSNFIAKTAIWNGNPAITLGSNVFYKQSINRNNEWWFNTIGHEQKHREDIENTGITSFYSTYILDGIRSLGSHDDIQQEKAGTLNEKYSTQLWNYNGGEVGNIFNTGNITENERSSMLESVGSRFRRDVILKDEISGISNLINNTTNLMNNLGNSDGDKSLKTTLSNFINRWKQNVNDAKNEQNDITKRFGN